MEFIRKAMAMIPDIFIEIIEKYDLKYKMLGTMKAVLYNDDYAIEISIRV